ncbi:RRH [Mytilus coruscus]|uniref:RRH n=1 Tax=Mytilus coruscus TaxID=42192 RepID=A0A6J8AHG4_MYTCO|nr:RRH [Mytilus coruscus]
MQIRHDSLQRRYRLTRQCWNRRSHMEKTITLTIVLMIAAFSLSWFPYAIVCLWSIITSSEDIPVGLAVFPAIIAKVSVVWNPLIYIARTEQFRCAMVNTIPCFRVVSGIICDNNNFAIEDIEIPVNNENRITVVRYSNQFSPEEDMLEYQFGQLGPPKVEVRRKNQNDLKSPKCIQNNVVTLFCSESNISVDQNNDAISLSIGNCNKDVDNKSEADTDNFKVFHVPIEKTSVIESGV